MFFLMFFADGRNPYACFFFFNTLTGYYTLLKTTLPGIGSNTKNIIHFNESR